MNNTTDRSMLTDCYHVTGKDFPMPENTDKGVDSGPQDFAGTSDRQLAPRLNASLGKYGPSTKGAEGAAFPTDANGKESADEQPVFSGKKIQRWASVC